MVRGKGGWCKAGLVACSLAVGVSNAQTHAMHEGGAPGGAPATGAAAEVQRSYAAVKANIMKSADKMPADDFGYKPVPDVRTYARVLNHVSEAQLRTCGTANHTASGDLAKVPEETAGKEAVVTALKASFAECDKAFAALTDANLTEGFTIGPATRSRIGMMWGAVSHDTEQYATLALYLRLKGLAPPSSEK